MRLARLALALGAGGACGSLGPPSQGTMHVTCDDLTRYACPNDAPLAASDLALCRTLVSEPACGSTYQTLLDCALMRRACDANGQALPPTGCDAAQSAYTACKSADAGTGVTCSVASLAPCVDGSSLQRCTGGGTCSYVASGQTVDCGTSCTQACYDAATAICNR